MMADGETQEVSGTVPAQYEVAAHELICSFKKTDAEAALHWRCRSRAAAFRADATPPNHSEAFAPNFFARHRDSTACSRLFDLVAAEATARSAARQSRNRRV